jgi:hypothetical protein
MPDNRGDCAKVLHGREKTIRVVIVRRPDGHYAIRPEQWRENLFYEGATTARWVPIRQVSGVFETIELAEKEARLDYADYLPKEISN